MPYSTEGRNTMVDAWRAAYPYVGLHTAAPSTGAPNEVTGGSPAYARKLHGLAAASGGASEDAGSVVFDVPGGTTVTHVGYWSAASGGTCGGYDDVTSESFAGQGTYTLTDQTVDANA